MHGCCKGQKKQDGGDTTHEKDYKQSRREQVATKYLSPFGYYPAFWTWALSAEIETKRLPGKLSSRRRVASTV